MRPAGSLTIPILLAACLCATAFGVERFPPPQFESDYSLPTPTVPSPRPDLYDYLDTIVLVAALALASYLVLKTRSRRAVFALMLFSLAYFGFYRKGCVCSIGAIQNLTLCLVDPTYHLPIPVLAFFFLPLLFTLFFGRTFCAAVCPLGAIQDLVLCKPLFLPRWLEHLLQLFAYLYLASAVLFAATQSAFIICRYDPFVGFFRLSANPNMLALGIAVLLIAVFIGRPYCRFVCPYGVLLRHLSRLSSRRLTICPDQCINCRLCEQACPFNAIDKPSPPLPASEKPQARKTFVATLLLIPFFTFAAAVIAPLLTPLASRVHPTVRLAERIHLEQTGQVQGTTDASAAFRATGQPIEQLFDQAAHIRCTFRTYLRFAGAFFGLVVALKLVAASTWPRRTDYQADPAACFCCARCFDYCPRQRLKRKTPNSTAPPIL